MKYLILIYSNPAKWQHPTFLHQRENITDDDRAAYLAEFTALVEEISTSGELVSTEMLDDPGRAMTVRIRDGARLATDGPYAETKEQLAGYFVVDCADERRAADIAARIPESRFSAVEVRPITQQTD